MNQKLKIILFCDRPNEYESASTIIDHIDSFGKYSGHDIVLWSTLKGLPEKRILESFDCLIIHYSISLLYERYVSRGTLERIKSFAGLKILFIQDEYRRVNFACGQINYAGIDMVYSCAPEEVARKMYASLDQNIILNTTLTGYVPEGAYDIKLNPISERTIDVGYRARKCPFFLGKKGIEKYLIGKSFLENTNDQNLICDVSSKENDRLYGKDWTQFVSNCKTTLGTESGSSIIDFTGEIEYNLNLYQAFHPFAVFEDLTGNFLDSDGELEIQVISPRCFEAAALGTVLVLYPGTYSEILKRDEHFIGLEKDFSNIKEVVERMKDDNELEDMAKFCRTDLVESGKYSYERFIQDVDQDINKLIEKKNFKCMSNTDKNKSISIGKVESLPSVGNNIVRNLFHKIWRILPEWIRFILMVTVLRKKYFCHFDKEKYSYLNN